MTVGADDEARDQHGELGVLRVPVLAIGQAADERAQLGEHFRVERGDAAAQLRAAERGGADLREQDAPHALGRHLEKEEVERAREGALGIEDVELRFERRLQILDDLIDGRDQQRFLGHEVVVDEAGRHARGCRDALHRCALETVLHDGRAQGVDDLAAARFGEARPTHK